MSKKRFDLKVAKITIENNVLGILKSSPEELKRCQDLLQDFVKGKDKSGKGVDADPRTRLMAAKAKLDLAKEIHFYENPQVQKSELLVQGLPKPPSSLTVRVIGSKSSSKK